MLELSTKKVNVHVGVLGKGGYVINEIEKHKSDFSLCFCSLTSLLLHVDIEAGLLSFSHTDTGQQFRKEPTVDGMKQIFSYIFTGVNDDNAHYLKVQQNWDSMIN